MTFSSLTLILRCTGTQSNTLKRELLPISTCTSNTMVFIIPRDLRVSSKDGWGRAFYSLPINAQRNFGIPCLHLFSGLRIYSDICKHLSSEIQGTHITSQRNSLISALAANTGFYFVRNNERTRHFFNVFVRMGDYVLK